MKQFIVVFVSFFLVIVYGAPHLPVLTYNAIPQLTPVHWVAPAPVSSQWHAQDALGQYSYGYSGGSSAKSEVKTLDGITSGSYSYIDPENKLQTVNYVADAAGFRVAATNLPSPPVDNNQAPQPVEDTIEVKAARAEHLAAHAKEAQNSESEEAEVIALEAPQPVEDTPEVKQAKVEHQQAYEKAAALAAESSEDSGDEGIQTVAIHTPTYYTHHVLPYAVAPAPTHVRTIVPQSFAYSVHSHNYPYYITSA